MASIDEDLARAGAVLVEDRMLRRLIKRHRGLSGLGLQVPHAHCYALPRSAVASTVTGNDLSVELTKLPDHVVAIHLDRDDLEAGDPEAITRAWRLVFHAKVHEAFDALLARKALTAGKIRDRINRIGQTEFDEVRLVLRQEDLLFPPEDDVGTYVEFVALYLELQAFAPRALQQTFPSLHDAKRVQATIAMDVDAAGLLANARPAFAPPEPADEGEPDAEEVRVPPAPSTGFAAKMYKRAAEGARRYGNHARAAMLSVRAGELDTARDDLEALVTRLRSALGATDTTGWADALLPVAQFAAADRVLRFVPGARLLHDLQSACVDAERELQVVDAVTWALSRGKQKIIRKLPATREIRVARHLHAAAKKIPKVEVGSGTERDRLAEALHAMVERADHNVRTMMRPKIEAALEEVKLEPRHLPERVAQKKIVDELLDHAVAGKRLSLGHLRDAIAHNDLKLPDIQPMQLATGDQLLLADKELSESLDGVYRRGEIYMRFLQKVSSILSGNVLGRLLTLYVLLPAVGSFFIIEGLQHMVGPVMKKLGYVEPHIATTGTLVGTGAFLFLLLHVPPFRSAMIGVARGIGRVFRLLFWDIPRRVWRVPLVRPLTRWIVLPAIPALIVLAIDHDLAGWIVAVALFAGTTAVINASVIEELVSDWLLRSGRHLTRRILPGLVKYAIEVFARLIEWLERGIYRVDEMLRFRPGQSRATVVIKGVLGFVWFLVSYFLRFYVNLFVEPTVNPIKHFPVVTVAAKLILPFIPQMTVAIADATQPFLGETLALSFAGLTVLVLPGIAGFLAWELNGNWKLYRETRNDVLFAERIGSHGETMVAFMKPGFHSGTIPKLHGKLRRATWKRDERAAAKHKEGLHHVEEAIRKFADRQLVSMLNESVSFRAADVTVGEIEIGSNRVRIELVCPSVGAQPAAIAFEQQSGWLLAGIPQPGWILSLDPEQRKIFEIALAGFYKLSGADLVRDQIEPLLADRRGAVPAYDVSDDGLVVWPGPGFDTELVYPLDSANLSPVVRGAPYADTPPVLRGHRAIFGREPIKWDGWTQTWERFAFGMEPKPLLVGPSLLPVAEK